MAGVKLEYRGPSCSGSAQTSAPAADGHPEVHRGSEGPRSSRSWRVRWSAGARARGWHGLALFALAAVLFAPNADAYEQRTNTFSLGIQGGVGFMNGDGDFTAGQGITSTVSDYREYDLGPALSIHIRYSLDRAHALGFTFEDLRFDRKSGSFARAKQYQLNNFMAEYYNYFNRRNKVSQYIGVGAGFHKPTFRIGDQENILPGEGFIANLSGGVEYFVRRPFSIDATVKGYYIKPDGGTVVAGGLLVGIHYYLTR